MLSLCPLIHYIRFFCSVCYFYAIQQQPYAESQLPVEAHYAKQHNHCLCSTTDGGSFTVLPAAHFYRCHKRGNSLNYDMLYVLDARLSDRHVVCVDTTRVRVVR